MNAIVRPAAFDVARIRQDFPILTQTVRGKPLVFLDSAASAQKPRAVIGAMVHAMEHQYANIHRGLHWMSERTTEAYEMARDASARLLNANDRSEIVFVRNSTEAINLVAHSYGRSIMKPGQAVLISGMEHHSNIVPWQMLRDSHGIELRVAPITDAGELDMAATEALLADGKVGLVAITHMSNVLNASWPLPTSTAPRSSSTAARPWCTGAWTCRRWARISTASLATSCMAPPASACSGAAASCSMPCRPSSAAET